MSYDVSTNLPDHPKEKDRRSFYYHYFYGTTYPVSLFSLFHSLQTLSTANCQYIPRCMRHVYHCLLLLFEIQSKTSTIGRSIHRFNKPVILMKSFLRHVIWTWDTPAPSIPQRNYTHHPHPLPKTGPQGYVKTSIYTYREMSDILIYR